MKKNGFLALALALALLAGCSAKAPKLVAAADDIAYQTADIQRDAELLTVNGAAIPAEKYLFWLASSVQTAKQYMELETDEDWAETMSDGLSVAQAMKADALETVKLYQVVEAKAAELGVTVTEEQQKEMDEQLQQVVEELGGEEEFQAHLDSMCISREGFIGMNRVYFLNQGIKEKLTADGTLTVTQADKDQVGQELKEQAGLYAAKHILLSTRRVNDDGTYEEMSDEEKAAVKERVETLRQRIRENGDSEAFFDELMNEFSEDGRDENGNLYAPDGYGLVYAGQMVPEFEEGALSLQEGEIGEPVATAYGYHIIMRIPLDEEEFGQMVEQYCTPDYKLQKLTEEWVAQAEVKTTTAYDELDPKAFYDRLTAINEAREAARAAAESAAPSETPAGSEAPAESPAA